MKHPRRLLVSWRAAVVGCFVAACSSQRSNTATSSKDDSSSETPHTSTDATNTSDPHSAHQETSANGSSTDDFDSTLTYAADDFDDAPVTERAPAWTARADTYGVDKASISFHESGAANIHVWQWGGLGHSEKTFDSTGNLVPNEPPALGDDATSIDDAFAVDPDGRFHAVSTEGGCRVVVDEADIAKFGGSCEGGYGFAPDGSHVSQVSCNADVSLIHVRVFDVRSGVVKHDKVTDLTCGSNSPRFETPPLVVTDVSRSRTMFASPEHPQIFVFYWDDDTVRKVSVYGDGQPSDLPDTGTVHNISLSYDGLRMAAVGATGGLAWLDPETYEITNRNPNVRSFTLFDECDCRTLQASVIAWSRDGRYFATTSATGGLDLRETESQRRLMTLTAPTPPGSDSNLSSERGPVLARFSPNGEKLVALYPSLVSAYDLGLP
jgi:hypothetical protein